MLVGSASVYAGPHEDYDQQWADRERDARNEDSRVELAKDLVLAAKDTIDAAYKALLCEKAYAVGSRHLSGYAAAAEALDMLQRADPDRRLWCLNELRQLYGRAFRMRPAKLRLGTGLADVSNEMAEQRYETYTTGFDAGEVSIGETLNAYRACVADIQLGVSALDRVIRRAARDARAVEQQNPSVARSLRDFVKEFEPKRDAMLERRKTISAMQTKLTRLQTAETRFERSPDPAGAQYLAAMYIVDWNSPELVRDEIQKHLPDNIREPLVLSMSNPSKLTGPEADMLARWFAAMTQAADDNDAKADMLVRALYYRQIAEDRKFENAQQTADAVVELLAEVGISNIEATRRTQELGARLEFQFGSDTAAEVAMVDENHDTHDPVTHHTDPDPQTDPDPVADPDEDPGLDLPVDEDPDEGTAIVTVTTTRSAHTGGRPMVVCQSCGRRFFPGWGVKADKCERCKDGGENIFDFGKD